MRKVAISRSACAELICVNFKAVMAARIGKIHTEIISPCIDTEVWRLCDAIQRAEEGRAILMQRFLLTKMHQRQNLRLLREST